MELILTLLIDLVRRALRGSLVLALCLSGWNANGEDSPKGIEPNRCATVAQLNELQRLTSKAIEDTANSLMQLMSKHMKISLTMFDALEKAITKEVPNE